MAAEDVPGSVHEDKGITLEESVDIFLILCKSLLPPVEFGVIKAHRQLLLDNHFVSFDALRYATQDELEQDGFSAAAAEYLLKAAAGGRTPSQHEESAGLLKAFDELKHDVAELRRQQEQLEKKMQEHKEAISRCVQQGKGIHLKTHGGLPSLCCWRTR